MSLPSAVRVYWRKFLIALTGVLICAYALWVLWYVHSTPDIGLRTAFDPKIRRIEVNAVFQDDDRYHTPEVGDRIISLNGHPIRTWPNLLQALRDLDHETPVL